MSSGFQRSAWDAALIEDYEKDQKGMEPFRAEAQYCRNMQFKRDLLRAGDVVAAAGMRIAAAQVFLCTAAIPEERPVFYAVKKRFIQFVERTFDDSDGHAVAMARAALDWDRRRIYGNRKNEYQLNEEGLPKLEILSSTYAAEAIEREISLMVGNMFVTVGSSHLAGKVEGCLRRFEHATRRDDAELVRATRHAATQALLIFATIPAAHPKDLRYKRKVFEEFKAALAPLEEAATVMVATALSLDLASIGQRPETPAASSREADARRGRRSLH